MTRTVILLYRPEAANPWEAHAVGDKPTDPFNGIEVYAILDSEPADLDNRLQRIADEHTGWKFNYETTQNIPNELIG